MIYQSRGRIFASSGSFSIRYKASSIRPTIRMPIIRLATVSWLWGDLYQLTGSILYLKIFSKSTILIALITTRIEIFLIDLQTEEVSKRTYSPTDYLQINNREILFGEKQHLTIFNESSDAIITFKTDLFFNKRGFLLFYRGNYKLNNTTLDQTFLKT